MPLLVVRLDHLGHEPLLAVHAAEVGVAVDVPGAHVLQRLAAAQLVGAAGRFSPV